MTTESLEIITNTESKLSSTQLILFVCTGNICRSPYMEFYFRQLLSSLNLPNIEVVSAGTGHMPEHHVAEKMAKILQAQGIETDGFRSQPLTKSLVKHSNLIVTAEVAHRAAVLAFYPGAHAKVFTLLQVNRLLEHANHTNKQFNSKLPIDSITRLMANARGVAGPGNYITDNIPDPWRCPTQVYQDSVDLMSGPLERLAMEISHQNSNLTD